MSFWRSAVRRGVSAEPLRLWLEVTMWLDLTEVGNDDLASIYRDKWHSNAPGRGRERPHRASLPWLSGVLVFVAAPIGSARCRRISRHRARHAWLRADGQT